MIPSLPINPQGTAPAPQNVGNASLQAARVAAVAAIAGVQGGLTATEAAIGGAAVAPVVLAAVRGAPQIGCHLHPSSCAGEVCSMSIHQFVHSP